MGQEFSDASRLIRVAVVASSAIARAGLEKLLADYSDLEVVGSAARVETLSQQLSLLQPDVVLLEWTDSEVNSLPAIPSLPEPPAFVLLMDEWQPAILTDLLRAGVRAMLPIDATVDEIVTAIQSAAIGLGVIHPDLLDALLETLPAPRSLPVEPDQPLTNREVEVLRMLAEGLGNKAIAHRLNISEHTVKFHIGSIFSKLNATSRTEAVILGARQGLILL